jgi:hypothetical protein
MTDDQALDALMTMRTFWPRPAMDDQAVLNYVRVLRPFDQDQVLAAIDKLALTCRFLPTVAEIVEHCDEPVAPRRMTLKELQWSGHDPDHFSDERLPEGFDRERYRREGPWWDRE